MSLAAGTRLGPYELVAAIGSGGMGEVYRAKDTRLDRTVAIKVLPGHVASDPDLRQRFEREAKTLAALSHPHICPVFDVGQQDGVDFLVMEYLEGETLAQRLKKGPLPLDQVLRYAIEIADAIDKAHRQGIVHRDLKPGNIMLTRAGAKLLDFGLAKLRPAATGAVAAMSAAPTISSPFGAAQGGPLTAQGTILGTLQYMAPEQLEGKEADARTDIFAFGAVLYEMVTGKKAFEGTSPASLISAIMSSEPRPLAALQPLAPALLERLVKKCLAKDADARWQSAGDLEDELRWLMEGAGAAAVPTVPAGSKRRQRVAWLTALVVAALIAGLAYWAGVNRSAQAEREPIHFLLKASPLTRIGVYATRSLVVSPDGQTLIYVGTTGETRQLFRRTQGEVEGRPMLGTEGAYNPFLSPDGQWVGFFAGFALKKVPISGGAVELIYEGLSPALVIQGASWGPNDTIAVAGDAWGAVAAISGSPGNASALTTLDASRRERSHRWPRFLPPGGEVMLLTVIPDWFLGMAQFWKAQWQEAVASFESAIREGVLPDHVDAMWGWLFLVKAYAGDADALPVFASRRSALPSPGSPRFKGAWDFVELATEGLAVLGEWREAHALYPALLRSMELRVLESPAGLVAMSAGIAAACGGDWDRAEQHYQTALRQAHEIPHKIAQPEVRRWYAQMLIDRNAPGDCDRARTLLGEAIEMYRTIGMPKHLAMAEALLGRA